MCYDSGTMHNDVSIRPCKTSRWEEFRWRPEKVDHRALLTVKVGGHSTYQDMQVRLWELQSASYMPWEGKGSLLDSDTA